MVWLEVATEKGDETSKSLRYLAQHKTLDCCYSDVKCDVILNDSHCAKSTHTDVLAVVGDICPSSS